MDKNTLTPIQALEAIKARINGIWDNEQLLKIESLHTEVLVDIEIILDQFDVPI